MKKLYRSALVAGVLALGVAACGDDVTIVEPEPTPPPPLSVTMTPSNQSIGVGEVADFAVGVSGGADGAQASWTCSSSASGVASVATTDTGCRATGVAAGNASITVTVTKGNQSANAGAQVVVTSVSAAPATITIASITQDGSPVDIENISGQIDVTLNVNPRDETIQRVVLYVDGVEVASQVFASAMADGGDAVAQALQQITLSFRSDFYSIDAAAGTGTPRHKNGDRVISAALEVVGADANRPSNSVPVRFNNESGVHVTTDVTTKPAAMSTTGETWYGGPDFGSMTVTAIPVNYGAGTVSSVTLVSLCASGTQTFPVTDNTAPFSFSRTCATHSGAVAPTFTWVRDGTSETVTPLNNTPRFGLSAHPFPVRVDRVAPAANGAATAAPVSGWFGSNSMFAQSGANLWITGGPPTDTGVENLTYQYQYTTAPATTSSTWTTFTSASDLPETDTNVTLAFRVRACDALLNCTSLGNELVGSDQTPPVNVEYTAGSPEQGDILAGGEIFALTGADALSGPFDTWGTLRRLNANGNTTCVRGAGTACNNVSSTTGAFATTATIGYWTFSGVFRDVALNTTAPAETSRTAIFDNVAPQVVNVNVPLSVTGGAQASFSATATDNLDLQDFVYQTVFGAFNLPHGPRQSLGTFGAPLLQQAPLSASVSFIRSLETTAGVTPAGAITAASQARFEARDFADNIGFATGALIGVPAGTTAGSRGVNEWETEATPPVVCVGTGCGTTPATTQLEAMARGVSGEFAAPFARVIFYRNDGGVLTYIGETTSRVSTDDGSSQTPPANATGRVWTYSGVSFTPMLSDKGGVVNVHAVGVSAAGDALLSDAFVVTVN
jgi:hypothetical protein